MLGKPSTMPDSDIASVLTSTDCSNSEVFVHVELQKKILSVNSPWYQTIVMSTLSNMPRDFGNLTSTPH